MQRLVFIIIIFKSVLSIGQEMSTTVVDSLYREDQFYVGVTYNLLGKIPNNLSQNGFSGGYHLGFIKDMPINKRRNFAIGMGLGLSSNSYNQNLLIDKDENGNTAYAFIDDSNSYSKNKFSSHLIEIPLEFRWRTSTPEEYRFWRIYTGFKLGYVFAHSTKYRGDLGTIKHTNIKNFNDLQYGLTLSVGYNTWNIHCYYTLNPIFINETRLDGKSLEMNVIKIGLMFYIL